jgi:hypothetical protein
MEYPISNKEPKNHEGSHSTLDIPCSFVFGSNEEFFHFLCHAPMTRIHKAVPGRADEFRKRDIVWGCPVMNIRATLPSME